MFPSLIANIADQIWCKNWQPNALQCAAAVSLRREKLATAQQQRRISPNPVRECTRLKKANRKTEWQIENKQTNKQTIYIIPLWVLPCQSVHSTRPPLLKKANKHAGWWKTRTFKTLFAPTVQVPCPFSSAEKWHFERPNLRTDSENLAKHPPKWWGRHLVHFWASIKPIF